MLSYTDQRKEERAPRIGPHGVVVGIPRGVKRDKIVGTCAAKADQLKREVEAGRNARRAGK